MVGKYIGQRRIKSLQNYNDSAFYVIFDDGTHSIIAKIIIEKIATPRSQSPSDLRAARLCVIAEAVLILFKDYNLELSELDQLCQTLKLSIEDSVYKANNILWEVEYKTMLDIDRVLQGKRTTLKELLDDPVDNPPVA